MKYSIYLALFSLPAVTLAQGAAEGKTFASFVYGLGSVFSGLFGMLMALAAVAFLWGLMRTLLATGQEQKDNAKAIMIWGIIGLVVLFSLFGILNLLGSTFEGFGIEQRPSGPII